MTTVPIKPIHAKLTLALEGAKLMGNEDVVLWLTPGEAWAIGFALSKVEEESFVSGNAIRPVTTITVPNAIPHNPKD